MSRQSEFKMKFNPIEGKFTKQHIWGGDQTPPIYGGKISDIFSKIFGTTIKKAAKKGAEKAVVSTSRKAGEYAGKKAGDKIVKMLSKEKAPPNKKTPNRQNQINKKVNTLLSKNTKINPNTLQHQINQRVNAILSGGGPMKKII